MLNTKFKNPDVKDSSLNVFMKGQGFDGKTIEYFEIRLKEKTLLNSSMPTTDSYEAYASFRPNEQFLGNSRFNGLGPVEYVILDFYFTFRFNTIDGFEFQDTQPDYFYAKNITDLGRQATQSFKFKKTAYFPKIKDPGRRTFLGVDNSYKTKIYIPKPDFFPFDVFTFNNSVNNNRFNNAKIYVDKTLFEADFINGQNPQLTTFQASGGTIIFIDNYEKPETPQNLDLTNITSNSFDIDFSTIPSFNPIGDFEVFCVKDGDRSTEYFYHKEIKTESATITDLEPGTTYKVKVRATDIYYNLSNFTEEIEIQTLTA